LSMAIALVKHRENPLLRRREVHFEVEHVGRATPSIAEVRERLTGILNAGPDALYILRLETMTGLNRSRGLCHIYEDAEKGNRLEPEHVRRLNMEPARRGQTLEELKKQRAARKAAARAKTG